MNKIIGWPITWLLFYIGHITAKATKLRWEWSYELYNWAMINSVNIQDWAGLKNPWKSPSEKQEV